MQSEVFRNIRQTSCQLLQGLYGNTRFNQFVPFDRFQERCPVDHRRRFVVITNTLVGIDTLVHRSTISLNQIIRIFCLNNTRRYELIRIQPECARVPVNDLIHPGLRHHGFILLIVAKATETNHVNHDILMKPHAEIKCQFSHQDHGFRIIPVHMKNRRLNHLGDIGTIECRTAIARIRSRESDLIIDDDMDSSACTIATRLRQIKCFHDHTLSGESRITMDQHGQYLIPLLITQKMLPGSHRTFHDRVNNFQMRRIKSQRQSNNTTGRLDC